MNFDEKIKHELENEAAEIDKIMLDDQGLFDMLIGSFNGGLRRWIILMNIITLVVTGLMVWSGYRFYIAIEINEQILWGVSALFALNMQIALKQWLWMEMNRSSLMREIKRVELAVSKLN